MNPSYWAVIPANVRYSNLKPNAKLLYGEISALSNKEGYCFATNMYFAKLYNVTKNTISLWISQLNKAGFVSVTLIKKGEQITERRIGIINNDDRANIKINDLNSININNTNNISLRKEKFISEVLLLEKDKSTVEAFIMYWSEYNKSKTKMRFEMEKTWELKARLQRWKRNQKPSWNGKPQSKVKAQLNTYTKAKEMMNQINNQ
jgi:hypothetical protein